MAHKSIAIRTREQEVEEDDETANSYWQPLQQQPQPQLSINNQCMSDALVMNLIYFIQLKSLRALNRREKSAQNTQ